MPKENISRTHSLYTKIDRIKDYEITNCIAYEMAIRNKELLTLLFELHFEKSESKILKIIKDLDSNFLFNTNCINYFNKNFHFNYAAIVAPSLNLDQVEKSEIKTYNYQDNELYFTKYTDGKNPLPLDINSKFEGFCLQTDQHNLDPEIFLYNFSRPVLESNQQKKVFFEINPTFQKDEILSHVEHILESLNKLSNNKKIYIDTLLNQEKIDEFLKDKKDIQLQREKNENAQKMRARIKQSDQFLIPDLTKQNLLANQFLIYDYIKYTENYNINLSKVKIYENINRMINDFIKEQFIKVNGGINAKCFKNKDKLEDALFEIKIGLYTKTIKLYFETMKDFIENRKYQSLIS